MENSDSFDLSTSFPVINWCFKRLNLKLFCSSCWKFNVIVFVEQKRNVILRVFSLHLFAAVAFNEQRLGRVEVEPIDQKILERLVFCKNQEVDAKDSIDLCF